MRIPVTSEEKRSSASAEGEHLGELTNYERGLIGLLPISAEFFQPCYGFPLERGEFCQILR